MARAILIQTGLLVALLTLPHSVMAVENKALKGEEAYERGISALEAGNIQSAINEAVMASTLEGKARYFLLAARAYMRAGSLEEASPYLEKAVMLPDFNAQESASEKNLCQAEFVKQADNIILKIKSRCPVEGINLNFDLLSKLDNMVGQKLSYVYKQQSVCFFAQFPELPRPLKIVQNGVEARVAKDNSAEFFMVYPGMIKIISASHPAFSINVAGTPGSRQEFKPRSEKWMQGKLLLKGVPDNANVFVDGKKVALENNALFVEPFANHSLVVSATGRKNFSSDKLQLEMAGNIDVNVRCIKKPSWYPWLLFGGGLAFMGTGGYFLGVGLTGTPSYSFDGSGSVTNIGYHQAIGQQEEARRSGIIGIVGLSVGGAMLIGSVLWMLLEDTTPPEWRKK